MVVSKIIFKCCKGGDVEERAKHAIAGFCAAISVTKPCEWVDSETGWIGK